MTENERITHRRMSGTGSGYWSAATKQGLIGRLAEYEDTGLTPEQIRIMLREWHLQPPPDTAGNRQ